MTSSQAYPVCYHEHYLTSNDIVSVSVYVEYDCYIKYSGKLAINVWGEKCPMLADVNIIIGY